MTIGKHTVLDELQLRRMRHSWQFDAELAKTDIAKRHHISIERLTALCAGIPRAIRYNVSPWAKTRAVR